MHAFSTSGSLSFGPNNLPARRQFERALHLHRHDFPLFRICASFARSAPGNSGPWTYPAGAQCAKDGCIPDMACRRPFGGGRKLSDSRARSPRHRQSDARFRIFRNWEFDWKIFVFSESHRPDILAHRAALPQPKVNEAIAHDAEDPAISLARSVGQRGSRQVLCRKAMPVLGRTENRSSRTKSAKKRILAQATGTESMVRSICAAQRSLPSNSLSSSYPHSSQKTARRIDTTRSKSRKLVTRRASKLSLFLVNTTGGLAVISSIASGVSRRNVLKNVHSIPPNSFTLYATICA